MTLISFPPPPPPVPLSVENVLQEIGLIQRFFKEKLSKNGNMPLTEDEDLPQKQRPPKPRLPPNGKISSPRKRPAKEAGPGKGHPKKKMRHIEGQGWVRAVDVDGKEKKDGPKDGGEKGEENKKDGNGGKKNGASKEGQGQSQGPEKEKGPGPGSKLKHSTSAMDLDEIPSAKVNGTAGMVNGVDHGAATAAPAVVVAAGKEKPDSAKTKTKDMTKGKENLKLNGTSTATNGEGGMISPESLEA